MNVPEREEIELSIVIAAWNGISSLRQCLDSVEKQTDKDRTETIVVSNFFVPEKDLAENCKFRELSETATVPQLRSEGVAMARGKVIALIEDHAVLNRAWCSEIKKAHKKQNAVIGGSVENMSREKALNWAVYLYDYGKYMLPFEAGPAETLSGMNVSYKRGTLDEVREVYQKGFFETNVNEELKKRGHQLFLEPLAIVYHNKNYELRRSIEHSYHLARSYAANRITGTGLSKRAFFGMFSLFLPILLPARIVVTTLKKGRHMAKLIRSFPYIVFLMSVWSYGEFCGYLLGEGQSAGEWR